MSVVLSAQGVRKTFDDGTLQVEVLKNIQLQIESGDSLAIIGASGSGKSTLLHILGGLDQPDEGEIIIAEHAMHSVNDRQRGELRNRFLGFIYQFHHLLAEFSAVENVAMPLLIRGDNRETALQKAADVLATVGLQHRLQHRPAELSGGERQRTAIARAIVTRPKCILADEPTGNLDRKTADNVFAGLMELNQEYGTAIIMVTHDHSLATKMSRMVKLEDGVLR